MKTISLHLYSALSLAFTLSAAARSALIEFPETSNSHQRQFVTEAYLAKSEPVLRKVISQNELHTKWNLSEVQTLEKLSKAISCQYLANTSLIKISLNESLNLNRDKLLETLAKSVTDHHSQRIKADLETEVENLNHQLAVHNDTLSEKRKQLTILIQQYGIPYQKSFHADSPEEEPHLTEYAIYQKSLKRLDEIEEKAALEKSRIDQLLAIPDENLLKLSTMLTLPENKIVKYVEQHHQKLEEVAALNKLGLASNHPEVQAPSHQAKLALKDAFREASSLKEALELENEINSKQIAVMRERAEIHQTNCIDYSIHFFRYAVAVREYKSAIEHKQRLLDERNEKQLALKKQKSCRIHFIR